MKGLLFTYLLTYGGAAASLFNPFVGLLIYVCFAIIRPESLWFWSVPPGNYSRIIAVALLLGWLLHGLGDWRFGRGRAIVFCLLGFLAWAGVSALFCSDRAAALLFIESKAKIVLPFVVGITLIDSVKKLRQVAWVLALSQGYVAYDLNMSYVGGFNRLMVAGFGNMDNNCNGIAMVAGAGLAFFLGLSERIWWRKLLLFGLAALMAHVPMFGMSRGGILGLIVMGAAAFFLIPKKPSHYVAFALAVVIALRLAGPSVIERFSSTFSDPQERDQSANTRLERWAYCQTLMGEQPLVGVGPGNFPSVAIDRWGKGGMAHSLWFQIGAELGFPGLSLLLAFYGLTIWRLWRMIRCQDLADPEMTHFARMVIAALVGFGVSATFVSIEGLEIPYYIVLLGVGTLKLTGHQVVRHFADTQCECQRLWERGVAVASFRT